MDFLVDISRKSLVVLYPDCLRLNTGVLQGHIFGPLLFSKYTISIKLHFQMYKHHVTETSPAMIDQTNSVRAYRKAYATYSSYINPTSRC